MSGRHESWTTQLEVLESAIRATHRFFGNVEDVDNYHIVVGSGSGALTSIVHVANIDFPPA